MNPDCQDERLPPSALLRLSTCSDVRRLTPHGMAKHFMAEVHARRRQALDRITIALP